MKIFKLMLLASLVLAACLIYFAFGHGVAMRSDNPDIYRLLVPLPLAAIVLGVLFFIRRK